VPLPWPPSPRLFEDVRVVLAAVTSQRPGLTRRGVLERLRPALPVCIFRAWGMNARGCVMPV
jgi:hypothetical protein